MFKDVTPGKKYTLTYDTKEDADQSEVAKVVMLDRVIQTQHFDSPLRLDVPFEDLEDEGTAGV